VLDCRIWIDNDDDEEQELIYLHRWFTEDPEVSRNSVIRLAQRVPSQPGEMGGAFEAIIAILSDGTALGSLIISFLAWRDSRPRPPTVSIECRGITVNLSEGSPETVRRMVAALTEQPKS
jgi:hypothetical protein